LFNSLYIMPVEKVTLTMQSYMIWQIIVTIAAIRVTFGVSFSCGMVGKLFN
jgi:hypothetical protein